MSRCTPLTCQGWRACWCRLCEARTECCAALHKAACRQVVKVLPLLQVQSLVTHQSHSEPVWTAAARTGHTAQRTSAQAVEPVQSTSAALRVQHQSGLQHLAEHVILLVPARCQLDLHNDLTVGDLVAHTSGFQITRSLPTAGVIRVLLRQ